MIFWAQTTGRSSSVAVCRYCGQIGVFAYSDFMYSTSRRLHDSYPSAITNFLGDRYGFKCVEHDFVVARGEHGSRNVAYDCYRFILNCDERRIRTLERLADSHPNDSRLFLALILDSKGIRSDQLMSLAYQVVDGEVNSADFLRTIDEVARHRCQSSWQGLQAEARGLQPRLPGTEEK